MEWATLLANGPFGCPAIAVYHSVASTVQMHWNTTSRILTVFWSSLHPPQLIRYFQESLIYDFYLTFLSIWEWETDCRLIFFFFLKRSEKFARRLESPSFVKIQISLHTQILTLKMRDLFHHWFLTRSSIPRTNQPWCSTCLVSKGKITIRKPLSLILICRRKASKITAQA